VVCSEMKLEIENSQGGSKYSEKCVKPEKGCWMIGPIRT
jgi:hypothetical protein